jgi:diguanylate cyclase (GGDEF)-like protein
MTTDSLARHRLPSWQDLLVAVAYALLGWGSLQIAIPPDYVALVFLPAGLAVAAVLLRGRRALWGVFCGALLVQAMALDQTGMAGLSWTIVVPAIGASLQADVTAWAIRRWLDFPEGFDTPAALLACMLLVVPLGSMINASLSVPTLAAAGVIPWPEALFSAWIWWVGDALGVVLLLPVVLALFGSPASLWRPRVRTVALPMGVALGLVVGAVAMVRSTQERAVQARFQREFDDARQRLQRRFDAMTDAADAVATLIEQRPDIDAAGFRAATSGWLARYPGILNFGWSPLVKDADRSIFERRQTLRSSLPDGAPFHIAGRDDRGHLYPALPAPEYLPITLVEPFERNRQVIGLDVLVLPATAAAANCALTSGRPCVSDALRLVQETGRQQGVVLYHGVFDHSTAVRRPLGVASLALRMDELTAATLGPRGERADALQYCLVDLDGLADRRVLAGGEGCDDRDASGAFPAGLGRRLSGSAAIHFGQQDWVLSGRAGAGYAVAARDWTAWAVTATGFTAVGLLGAFLMVITGQARRTQRLVDQRTHELAQSNASLTQLAHFDPLTGLYNRTQWNELAQRAIDDARRHGDALAVLFIDIDRFKHINDSLGHSQGDLLLSTLSTRLKVCLRSCDVLARLGGDEFVLLLPRVRGGEDARHVGDKLMQALAEPVRLLGHDVTVTASLGAACFPADGDSVETLLQHADIAMYAAKDDGRNRMRFYSSDLHERLSAHLLLERELRRALTEAAGELRLEYQPQIDLASAAVVGVEALLRWQHPTLGAIRPDRFIPVAEQSGLIDAVDLWVLEQACEQLRVWQMQGLPRLRVAVNISAQDFARPDFLPRVHGLLAQVGELAQQLELEITESLLMQGQVEVQQRLVELTQLGPTLALDDFGTGYSNLGYLKRLPLAKLKIDRSFVVDLPGRSEDEALVRAIVSMAHDLGLLVLAEGVETAAQRDFLLQLGCDEIQGWLVAPSLAPPALAQWLSQDRAAPA